MGFGYLFIGYMLLLYPASHLPLAPAALLMWVGLRRLGEYNGGYRMAKYLCYPAFLGGGFLLLIAILGANGVKMPHEDTVYRIVSMAMWITLLFFHAALLRGTEEITEETGLSGLRTAAFRNLIFSSVYYAARCVLTLDFGKYSWIYGRIMLAVMLLGLVIVALNLILIYGCYMRICLPGQETKIQREYDSMVAGLKKNLDHKNGKKGDE